MKTDKALVLSSLNSLAKRRTREQFRLQRIRSQRRALLSDLHASKAALRALEGKIVWEMETHGDILRAS